MKKKDYKEIGTSFTQFFVNCLMLNHMYKLFMNDWVYRQINLYSLTENYKLLCFFIIVIYKLYYV